MFHPILIIPFILCPISPLFNPKALLFIFYKLPLKLRTINLHKDSNPMSHIILPLAFIDIAIRICHSSISLSLIIFPLSFIYLACVPFLYASAVSFIYDPFSFIVGAVFKNVLFSVFSYLIILLGYILPIKWFNFLKCIFIS